MRICGAAVNKLPRIPWNALRICNLIIDEFIPKTYLFSIIKHRILQYFWYIVTRHDANMEKVTKVKLKALEEDVLNIGFIKSKK